MPNITEIVPPPMMREYDFSRVYTNVYGNDDRSYMYDPNVAYVGFSPQAWSTGLGGFGDAGSDACDNDPNCHGSTDANGVLVNYTCDTLSSNPANAASPCYNPSMASFNAENAVFPSQSLAITCSWPSLLPCLDWFRPIRLWQ